MANTNFKIFAESASDVVSDAEYEVDTQRTNGVSPGLAEPSLHNKLYKQATMMGAAIAQVLVERGYNALDSNYAELVANIRRAFPKSINGKTANAQGDIDYTLISLSDVYPVGSVYTSVNSTNPATLFGGTWEQIAAGRCLIGAGDGYTAGTTGGEKEHALLEAEMPRHNHNGSTAFGGDHKHNRGTMNITGHTTSVQVDRDHKNLADGAFYRSSTYSGQTDSANGRDSCAYDNFDASRSWTGETSAAGNHTHSVSVGYTGSGSAHNNMQPYLVVYFWKRTA